MMTFFRIVWCSLALVSLMLILTSGSSAQTWTERERNTDTRPLDPRDNPPSLSERAAGMEASLPVVVQRSINGDPILRGENIKVAGNERRNVTLSGEVPTRLMKERAQELAERVAGVQHVHNNIVVLGTADEVTGGSDASTTDNSDPAHRLPQRE